MCHCMSSFKSAQRPILYFLSTVSLVGGDPLAWQSLTCSWVLAGMGNGSTCPLWQSKIDQYIILVLYPTSCMPCWRVNHNTIHMNNGHCMVGWCWWVVEEAATASGAFSGFSYWLSSCRSCFALLTELSASASNPKHRGRGWGWEKHRGCRGQDRGWGRNPAHMFAL